MSRRGRGIRLKENVPTVSARGTITAAFQRQTRRKDCPVCGQAVLLTLYRAHLDNCHLGSNDSDCEIVQILTAEESRALRAGPSIVIDGDGDSFVAENESASHRKHSQSKSGSSAEQQRSRRIEIQGRTIEEIEFIKIEEERTAGHECNPRDGSELVRTDVSNPVVPFKRARTMHCASPLLLSKSTSSSTGAEGCNLSSSEEVPISADELVRKIEDLLITPYTSTSSQMATFEDDGSRAEFKSAPYFVKFTLQIMRRVQPSIFYRIR
ncbi:hypothetical protein KIN20_035874 [Parelaphostrongylus tenuis]|uniref:Uncharacterized protein n=1 Tax=Parelaphostrongylus tenuis TaxID=148309 RepID=A0AAD5RCB5_PARTN|nr:hypothetical protein KIN20_035874 [Parelaphostrongylus tenuis]